MQGLGREFAVATKGDETSQLLETTRQQCFAANQVNDAVWELRSFGDAAADAAPRISLEVPVLGPLLSLQADALVKVLRPEDEAWQLLPTADRSIAAKFRFIARKPQQRIPVRAVTSVAAPIAAGAAAPSAHVATASAATSAPGGLTARLTPAAVEATTSPSVGSAEAATLPTAAVAEATTPPSAAVAEAIASATAFASAATATPNASALLAASAGAAAGRAAVTPGTLAPAATLAMGSSPESAFSAENYPATAEMYILAEVYTPLTGGSRAWKRGKLRAKLAQSERLLRFLVARSRQPVLRCVLGVVIMSPLVNEDAAEDLYVTLEANKMGLALLWQLAANKRLLAAHFKPTEEPMHMVRLGLRQADNSAALEAFAREQASMVSQTMDMSRRMSKLEKRFDESHGILLALQRSVDELQKAVKSLVVASERAKP